MGTCNGNKPPSYVIAADSISPESLSFSGLLSIQDQQYKSPSFPLNQSKPHGYDQTLFQSPEFEFATTKPTPDSVKTKPADLRISIEQLQSNQSSVTDHHHHHSPSLSTLLSAHGNGKRVSSGNTRKFDGVERERNPRSSKSFLESLLSPCRECHAFKPKVKSH